MILYLQLFGTRHHRAGGVAGALSRLDPHVDHRDAAGLDRGDRLTEHRRQPVGFDDRAETAGALSAGERRKVDFRVQNLLAACRT